MWISVFSIGYFYAKLSYDFPFRRRGYIYFPSFMMIFDQLNERAVSYARNRYAKVSGFELSHFLWRRRQLRKEKRKVRSEYEREIYESGEGL